MPTVTPQITRKSARTSVRPTRLVESPTDEQPKGNNATRHDLISPPSDVDHDAPTPIVVPTNRTKPVVDTHPSANYSRRDIYDRWIASKESCHELKLQLSVKAKELKAALKESSFYERKAESLDTTERKLRQLSQDLHEAKLDKKYSLIN